MGLKIMGVRTNTVSTSIHPRFINWFRIFLLFLIGLATVRLAWVSDDALITLRTALNATHGWGLGYNATESVQGFTHPLWFLLWMLVGVSTNQWLVGILVLSITLTLVATGVVLWQVSSLSRLIVVTAFLLFSNAFIEYSTSGLENPLSYLSLATFALLVHQLPQTGSRWVPVALGFTAAAVLLTRLDLVLIIFPLGILALWKLLTRRKELGLVLVTFLTPLLIWFSWSFANYGTLLPNTFEAKRNVDIPLVELVVRGLTYLEVSSLQDPVTAIGIVCGFFVAIVFGGVFGRAGAIGVLIYIVYVVSNGGDFMAGRFLAVPLFFSVTLMALVSPRKVESTRRYLFWTVTIITIILLATALLSRPPQSLFPSHVTRWDATDANFGGVADERGFYVGVNRGLFGLFANELGEESFVGFPKLSDSESSILFVPLSYIDQAAKMWPLKDIDIRLPSETAVLCGWLGTLGLVSGPSTHLIDSCALTDRFLAGRPYAPEQPYAWRVGHFTRSLPDGYEEAVRNNDPQFVVNEKDRFELERLWERIR